MKIAVKEYAVEKIWHGSYVGGVPQNIEFDQTALPQAFVRTCARFPEKTALVFQGTTVSFKQLNEMTSRFATALAHLGVKKGSKISFLLPNIVQTVVGIYGSLRLGAVVVMHNPRSDDLQLEFQLNNVQSEMVICLDVLVPRILKLIPRTGVKKIVSCHIRDYLPFLKKQLFPLVKKQLHLKTPEESGVLEFTELLDSHNPKPGIEAIDLKDTAFILHTSATTGKSKGVELSHANVCYNVQQLRAWFPTFRDGQEISVGCLPFFHVFGLTCALNMGIFYGYSNVLIPLPEPKSILEGISENRATYMAALPSFYAAMANDPNIRKYDIKSLKGCFSGGAPLPLETIRTFEKLTGTQICEGYGLTESGPVTHINPYGGKTKLGSIGLPLPNTDAKIVDVDDFRKEITTPGEPGELCIKGPQVMQGYVNMKEQTEKTLKDGWLLTGDIATFDEKGYFTIIDRKKDMIISRGYKIYPRDVDEVLFSHPKILEACAVGIPHSEQGEIVKIFVVPKKGELLTPVEIISYCRLKLPPHMVPGKVEFLTELPRNPVGKILRKELRRLHILHAMSNLKRAQ